MHKIFLALGIVFIIFAGIVAVISYELDNLQYTSQAPANFIRLSIVTSMMPYIVLAVVSFIVAFLTANVIKPAHEEILENQIETKPKQEADLEKSAQKEMENA